MKQIYLKNKKTLSSLILESFAYLVTKYPIADWLNDISDDTTNLPYSSYYDGILLQATKEDAKQFKLIVNNKLSENTYVYVYNNKTYKILNNKERDFFLKLINQINEKPNYKKYIINNEYNRLQGMLNRAKNRLNNIKDNPDLQTDIAIDERNIAFYNSIINLMSFENFDIDNIKKATGCIYRVNLPDNSTFIDYDKTLSKHSLKIQEYINTFMQNTFGIKNFNEEHSEIYGKELIEILQNCLLKKGYNKKQISKKLSTSLGLANINGIKLKINNIEHYVIFNIKELANYTLISSI